MKMMQSQLGLIAFLVAFVEGSSAQTFVVNNLDETPMETTNDVQSWSASSFRTGSAAHTLDGLIARLSGFDGGNEFISIYNNSPTNSPGSEVLTFQDNPENLGTNQRFRLIPDSRFELAADTTYWVVFGAIGDGDEHYFDNFWTASTNQTGDAGWSIGDNLANSFDQGGEWIVGPSGAKQLGIEASIVPEPSTSAFAIAFMLMGFVAFWRRRMDNQNGQSSFDFDFT